jgi:hypothetical protein
VLGPPLLLVFGELGGPPDPELPPTGDHAVLELYTRQAAHGRQLLGPYSRFGFHHPGPVFFYAAVPLFRAFGDSFRGITFTAFVLNVIAVALLLRLAGRAGTPGLLAAALSLAGFLAVRGPSWLFSAWNPSVAALPFGVAVFALAAFAAGASWPLPIAMVATSFAVQTHLGTAPALLAAIAVTALTLLPPVRGWLGLPPRHGRRRLVAACAVSFALAVLLWWLPVAEQFAPGGGNLSHIAGFARYGAEPHALSEAVGVVGRNATGWVAGANDEAPVLLAVPALLAGSVLAWALARRHQPFSTALALLSAAGLAAAVVSALRAAGPLHGYLFRWAALLGIAVAVSLAGAVGGRLGARAARPRRGLRNAAVLAALGVLAAVSLHNARLAWRTLERPPDPSPISEAAGRLAAQIGAGLAEAGVRRPLVEVSPGTDRDLVVGVLVSLDRRDVRFSVRPFGPFDLSGRWGPGGEDARLVLGPEGAVAGALLGRQSGLFAYLVR